MTSMKFPVAPQSIRAVVSTICVPLDSLMGIRMVLSFGRAVITWFTIWEEYVDSSSWAKNPQVLRMLCSLGGLHSTVSRFGGLQLHPFPVSSRFEHMLQWQRLGGGVGLMLGWGVGFVGLEVLVVQMFWGWGVDWLCWLALCPGFWHLKHSFSLIQQARSTGVNLVKEIASTSMAFGSRGGGFLDVKKDGFPFLPLMAAMPIFCA